MRQQDKNKQNIFISSAKKVTKWCWRTLDHTVFVILLILYYGIIEPTKTKVEKNMNIFRDMDENAYWLTIWTFIISFFMVLVSWLSYISYQEDILVAELVRGGQDPIELACLFNLSESLESSCFVISQAKAKVLSGETAKDDDTE